MPDAIPLTPPQLHASRYVIARVRSEVDADLLQASLFGSRARGDARHDSDVDILLVFRHLPPDREPYATQAERIADEEARRLGIPVTVWSVSLIDLALGNRTPMLVDALTDAVHLWCARDPIPPVPFTPRDALGCSAALLQRITEGSNEITFHLRRRDRPAAARRLRDDVVRLCTAANLLAGLTPPRRGHAIRAFIEREQGAGADDTLLRWAETSFGPDGTDEERPVHVPPSGFAAAAGAVEVLRREVARRAAGLRHALDQPRATPQRGGPGEWSLRSER